MRVASMEAIVGDSVSSQVKEWIVRKAKMQIYKERMNKYACLVCRTFWNVGRDDPRRVIHAFKVGFSLTLVSLLYLFEPMFDGVGQNAIWAVMTVVVVLEFTAGATLCKGLNRGVGTVVAGSLAFLIEFVANNSGHVFHAIFIAFAVFLIGEDLHKSTVSKLEGLATSIEACVQQYFSDSNEEAQENCVSDDPIYKAVLDSKYADETLFGKTLVVSGIIRKLGAPNGILLQVPMEAVCKDRSSSSCFGYTVVALHGCLQTEIQICTNSESSSCIVQGPLHPASSRSFKSSYRTSKQHKRQASMLSINTIRSTPRNITRPRHRLEIPTSVISQPHPRHPTPHCCYLSRCCQKCSHTNFQD
ncbi:Aluminum-activated malate transporter 12 [Bienertia sinuspersici]